MSILQAYYGDSSETESEEIDLNYIIENVPKTSILRDFMRANICSIRSVEDEMFDPIIHTD